MLSSAKDHCKKLLICHDFIVTIAVEDSKNKSYSKTTTFLKTTEWRYFQIHASKRQTSMTPLKYITHEHMEKEEQSSRYFQLNKSKSS